MADIISKEAYQYLKGLPPEELDDTDREKMNDYERAEVNAPSNDDVKWATHIHNAVTSNPHTHGYDKEEVDWANDILAQESRYFHLKGGRANDVYVQPVKRIPKDLIEGNDFKFNWKSAYENIKGEKLRDTEADYDKLKKFIDSNMFELNDPNVDLQKIAYKFHMYDPSKIPSELKTKEEIDAYFKNPWSYFINSEQGKEFKKYLADVRENQRKKEVEKIFSGEEPTKVNYPLLGPTDVPGSNFLVDFGLPVSKQAAYNAAMKNEEPNIGPAMAVDAASNILMALQPGSKAASPLISKGSNFVVPAVQNAGQYMINDEDPLAAGINTVLGGAVNIGTPYALNRFNKYTRMPGQQYTQRVQAGERADQIADRVGKIEKRLKDGALVRGVEELENTSGKTAKGEYYYNHAKKKVFTNYPAIKEMMEEQGYSVSPLRDMRKWKPGILSNKDNDFYFANSGVLRRPLNMNDKTFEKAVYTNNRKQGLDKEYKKVARSMAEGKDISQMNKAELEAILRGPAKETYMNWLSRNMPDAFKDYMTNAAGRSQMGSNVLSLPQMIFQTNLGKVIEERKKKKPKISEIFGGE